MTEDMARRFEMLITNTPEAYRSPESFAVENEEVNADTEANHKSHSHGHALSARAKTDNIVFRPGFVRLSFPFFMSQSCFAFVIKAILMVADNGWLLLPLYDFNRKTGKWWFRADQHMTPVKSLKDVSFLKGRFDILEPEEEARESPEPWEKAVEDKVSATSITSTKSDYQGFNYDEILQRAKLIFNEANTPSRFDRADQTKQYKDEAEELRWFMLPSEAADIVNKREIPPAYLIISHTHSFTIIYHDQVNSITSDQLPFKPGRPPEELAKYTDNRKRWVFLVAAVVVILALLVAAIALLFIWKQNHNELLATNETMSDFKKAQGHGFELFSKQTTGELQPPVSEKVLEDARPSGQPSIVTPVWPSTIKFLPPTIDFPYDNLDVTEPTSRNDATPVAPNSSSVTSDTPRKNQALTFNDTDTFYNISTLANQTEGPIQESTSTSIAGRTFRDGFASQTVP